MHVYTCIYIDISICICKYSTWFRWIMMDSLAYSMDNSTAHLLRLGILMHFAYVNSSSGCCCLLQSMHTAQQQWEWLQSPSHSNHSWAPALAANANGEEKIMDMKNNYPGDKTAHTHIYRHFYIYIYLLIDINCHTDLAPRRCSVEVPHSQTNVDATSQNSYGKNNKGTREY